MRDTIANLFGFRIDTDRLEDAECGELLKLHREATAAEGWEVNGFRNYGLMSKLEKAEQRRWRALVGKAAGGIDLDLLDEDAKTVQKIRELALRAMTPVPTRSAAPPGSAVLPGEVWDDVLNGRLLMIDVAVLAAVCFVFQAGRLHPHAVKRRDAIWAPDETLIIRDGLHRLLPQWSERIEPFGDTVGAGRKGIESRLAETAWLEVDRRGPHEVAVRLGARLLESL